MQSSFTEKAQSYLEILGNCITKDNLVNMESLARELKRCWKNQQNVFICGNGGSAANALHIANDLHYGIGACSGEKIVPGIRVEAISANNAIVTCLANDTGYENIFSNQLMTKGNKSDVLIVLSGSGNSPNIVKALEVANEMNMITSAIVGYSGGKCSRLAEIPIHIAVDDMQIAEDTQLIIGHIIMQWLNNSKEDIIRGDSNGRN